MGDCRDLVALSATNKLLGSCELGWHEAGRSTTYPRVNSSQVQLQMKASPLDLNALCFFRGTHYQGPWESRPHTQIRIIWGGFQKKFFFPSNFFFPRYKQLFSEGAHRYHQGPWKPGAHFSPPSAWRDERRKLLQGRLWKDWGEEGRLSGASLGGSQPGNQGNKTPPCTLCHPSSQLPAWKPDQKRDKSEAMGL